MFSIDEHPMYIYEVDGSYVEPMLVDSAVIYNGERYAAMVKLDKAWKDYTIRVPDTQGDQVISGFATMRYKGSSNTASSFPYVDYGGRNTTASVTALENKDIKPYPAVTIPTAADQLVNLTIGRSGSSYTWTTSGGPLYNMMANWDSPILYDLNAKYNLDPQVTIQTKNGTWVDLLLQLGDLPNTPHIQTPHVMHKHSNKAFILGVGDGFFSWSSTQEAIAARPDLFHLDNPQKRDTFIANGPSGPTWMLIRYQVVNPGPFLFHCHIETHMANGMSVALLDGVDQWPVVPAGEDQSPGAAQAPIPGQSVPPPSSSVQPTPTPSSSRPASSPSSISPVLSSVTSRPSTIPSPFSSSRPVTSSSAPGLSSRPSSSTRPSYSPTPSYASVPPSSPAAISSPVAPSSPPAAAAATPPTVSTPYTPSAPAQPTPPGYSSIYVEPPSPSWLRKQKEIMDEFTPAQQD